MNSRYRKGWFGESQRHYLAAKGVKTKRYYAYVPTYVGADMAPIAADGIGTAGAAVVPWIPVVVPLAMLYGGAKYVKNRKDKRKKQGKGFFAEKDAVVIEGNQYFMNEDGSLVEVNEYYAKKKAKKQKDYIKGGRSDGKKDSDYNQKELKMGRKVEMEHTKNPKIANEIAKDHLQEIPDYYTRLKKMEAKAGIYDARKDRRSGLFGPAKNEKLAKVITIKSPVAFKHSISTLKGKDGKVSGEEKKALVLARTRASMQLRRDNLKPETRKKFNVISQMELPEVR